MLCFFFFQAEDGIRDHCVTGVQTCALPISSSLRLIPGAAAAASRIAFTEGDTPPCSWTNARIRIGETNNMPRRCRKTLRRSEERRVGKECRSRWSEEE